MIGPCSKTCAKKPCTACILDTSDYFSSLERIAKAALQPALQRRHFERRSALYHEGQNSDHLFLLVSGEVKVYKSLPNGRQQIHKLVVVPGDLIACEDFYLDLYSSTAEAITETAVCYFKKSELQQIVGQQREISDTLMRSMARNLNAYIRHIANLGQKTAIERLASYLVFLSTTHNQRNLCSHELRDSLTRSELADMLGVTQRTLIRSLKALEKQSVISLTKDGFRILNPGALDTLSAGD